MCTRTFGHLTTALVLLTITGCPLISLCEVPGHEHKCAIGDESTETDGNGDSDTGDGDGDGGDGDGDGDQPMCGNDVIEHGEVCDGADLNSQTCESLGHFGGDLACTSECAFDVSDCQFEPMCGNGVIEGDEICDGDDFADATCETLGDFVGGSLQCSDTCDVIGTLGCLSPGEGLHCEDDMGCPVEAPHCINRTC